MLFASWLESALGWCCLGPLVLVAIALLALGSLAQAAAGWFESDGGVVEEIAKGVVKEVAEEVATSWLKGLLRNWFG